MTSESDAHEFTELAQHADHLDGYSLDALAAYLDAGRVPFDPVIEASPGCQLALERLARLRSLAPELLAADAAAEPEVDDGWLQGVLAGISMDARAGTRIPIPSPASHTDLGITEGALRGVVRAAERLVPGVVIGRCRFEGDLTDPGEPIRVDLDISVPYGEPIPPLVEQVRSGVAARLAAHAPLNITGIDITVQSMRQIPHPRGALR